MPIVSSRTTSLSWIPSEHLEGPVRVPFDVGLTHYDEPPPDVLTDLGALQRAGRFRFVNRVEIEVVVDGGRLTDLRLRPGNGGITGMTNLLGGAVRFPAIPMPDLRSHEFAPDRTSVVFRQTAGARAPLPAPRLVRGRLRLVPPLVWTTLELTLRADGSSDARVIGASAFPRHWVYDAEDRLARKVAVTDPRSWLGDMTADENPWRGVDPPALTSPAESALERRLSTELMHARPTISRLAAGQTLFRQGEPGTHVALLLDGMIEVRHDGVPIAEIGPGAVLGERALLEGARTADVIALTPVTVALLEAASLRRGDLEQLVEGHRRAE